MPAPTCPPLEYIGGVATALAGCGKTLVGSEHVTSVGAFPRYVWAPAAEVWSTDAPSGASNLGAFDTSFEVHVWGRDYVQTWRMRHALLTALADAALGSFTIGPAVWPPRGQGTAGTLCVQTVTVTIPIPRQQLPAVLGDEITDAEPLTGQATHIGAIAAVP